MSIILEETVCAVRLASIEGIGARRFAALVSRFGSARGALHAAYSDLADFFASGGREVPLRIVDSLKDRSVTLRIERLLEKAGTKGIRALPLTCPAYPRALRFIADPPPVLWVSGKIDDVALHVSMVGTRRSTPYGNRVAREMAQALSSFGIHIVSGLAYGIDSQAHAACVRNGKPTIAVLACPVESLLDQHKGGLPHRIVETGGALVSEYPPWAKTAKCNFVARNRIISGLSHGVVVIEAPDRSGALITAAFALEQGREVMAVPGSVYSPKSQGCHDLIRDGATLVRSAPDVLFHLGIDQKGQPPKVMALPIVQEMGDAEARVYSALRSGPTEFGTIVEMTRLDPVSVGSALGMLEMSGLVWRAAPGIFDRANCV